MAVYYQWDVELHIYYNDADEIDSMDVLDHDFCDNFKEAKAIAAGPPEQYPEGKTSLHIVLVRDGDVGRTWAYLEDDGKLPEKFMDAEGKLQTAVPKRFHLEVQRAK